jgi:hypothetical protein
MQKIADADTLVKKRAVELEVMRSRLKSEKSLKEPIDDDYGVDCINAMIADINAQYPVIGVNVGVAHDATSIVGTDDEDEEEDGDSNHELRASRRYVSFHYRLTFDPREYTLFGPVSCNVSRDHCTTSNIMYISCTYYVIGEILLINRLLFHSTYARSVSASTAHQQVHHSHWSHRVTSDNPHGFADKVLVRLRAIEDPAKREKEEKRLLNQRRWSEKSRLTAENVVRRRLHQNERNRQQKLNAGYVLLIVCLLLTL